MIKYGKVIVAILAAGVIALYDYLNDGHITSEEWVHVFIAVGLAVQVYLVPLTPEWPWMKTGVAVVLAVLNVLVISIVGGITQREIVELALAALTPLGVGVAPAISNNGQPSNP